MTTTQSFVLPFPGGKFARRLARRNGTFWQTRKDFFTYFVTILRSMRVRNAAINKARLAVSIADKLRGLIVKRDRRIIPRLSLRTWALRLALHGYFTAPKS